jgi:photosystem II stability/assembly factor-like uncharacterized protein
VLSFLLLALLIPVLPALAQAPPPNEGYTLLFQDEFDGGDADRWQLPSAWAVAQEGPQWFLRAAPEGAAFLMAPLIRSACRLRARVRLWQGEAALGYRASYGGYRLEVASDGLALHRFLGEEDAIIAHAEATIPLGTWHTMEVSGTLGRLQVSLDQALRLDYTDPDPWYAGSIALFSWGGPTAHVDFDSIQVLTPPEGEPGWVQTNGPTGGVIETIEIDPLHPDALYAAGSGGAVFKTTDRGATWKKLPQIASGGMPIQELLVSPRDPQVVYALAGALHKTMNGGQTWRPVTEMGLSAAAMDRHAPDVLLVGAGDGRVLRTADGGAHWADISFGLPHEMVSTIGISGPAEFWVGHRTTTDGRLYHTTDGHTWHEEQIDQAPETGIRSVYVDPEDARVVYVSMINVHNVAPAPDSRYFCKTTDGGGTWMSLRLPTRDAGPYVICRVPADNTLYVGAGGSLFKSHDGGQTWTYITPRGRNGDLHDIAVDPRDPNVLYLPRRAYGIVRSADQGNTWTPINNGLGNVTVSLLAAPQQPTSGTLFATGVGGEGTFRTTDRGVSWTNVTEGGITHPWADEIQVHPRDPQTIWEVADVAEVFRSSDGGTTWMKTIDTYGAGFRYGSVYALAPAPSDPDVIYALKNGFGLFKSVDGGQRWTFLRQSEVDYTYSIAVHPGDADVVYSGYSPKPFQDFAMVRQSTDGGITWRTALTVPHSSGITSVAIDARNPVTVYAGSTGLDGGRLFKTTDSGAIWSPLNPHFTMCTVWGQPQLIVDPQNPSVVYAATWLGGTWKSTDAGATWALLGGAPLSATALSMDARDSAVIYLADRAAPKLWKTTDGGATWRQIADFSSGGAFLVNRVLVAGDVLYASTFGPSIHGGKFYKSTDGGATWNNFTGTLPRSVLDIAVDPADARVIYVTTHIHGAFKSTDGGLTWRQMRTFPDIGAYDIEIDPVDPRILYACGLGGSVPRWCMPGGYTFADGAGVYKSTDAGASWQKALATLNECRAIRLNPVNHNVLFAASLDGGLQVSTDAGAHWASYNTGLDTLALTSCAVGGDRIYVGTQGCGVYAGVLNRASWAITWDAARSNKPVPAVRSLQIEVDPTNSRRIYVSANPGGLYRSDDGGATFYDKNFLTPSVPVDDPVRQGYYNFTLNPTDANEVWLGTWGKGIYKSYDGMDYDIGANGADQAMYGRHIYSVVISPTTPATVYAGTEEGVFRTRDSGATWEDISLGLGTPQARKLALAANGALLCGTAGYELYRYDETVGRWEQLGAFANYGTFWPIWNDRPLYQYTSLLFHPTDSRTVYLGTFPAGIYKSGDGGQSWRESNVGWTNDGVFCLAFRPGDPNVIYAGTYNGVNLSTDAGAHWVRWDQGWPGEQWTFSIDFDPRDTNVMYAAAKNGENEGTGRQGFHGTVMKTADGGAHWFPITQGLNPNQEYYKIIVDRLNPDIVYLATQYEGVFISRNRGELWLPWNEGLGNPVAGTNGNNVTNTMLLSADGRFLYLGTGGSGVYRRVVAPLSQSMMLPLLRRR